MTSQTILTAVRDRLRNELGDTVDKISVFSGELPDSILAGVPISGRKGFTILVGLRSLTPVRRSGDERVTLEVATLYIGVIRVHSGFDAYERELLGLMDMIDAVRACMIDSARPAWWGDAGFTTMAEQDTDNVTDPGLNFSAFELEYQFGVCRT